MSIIGDLMKQEAGGLAYWMWFSIFLGVACLLIVVILVTCLVKRNKKQADGDAVAGEGPKEDGKKDEVKEASKDEKAETKAEEKKEKAEEKPAEKKTAKKPADEKKETKEEPAKKATSSKTESAKKEEPKSKAAEEKSEANETKVYHISKRKDDGKWQVKAEGADRALRLFFTQADAIAYAKKVAGNQEGRIVVHKESGGFRKVNY